MRIPTLDRNLLYIDLQDDVIATRLIEYGEWENEITALMKKLVKPGMYVLDIGAHVGYYTTLLSDIVGIQGHVTAFEPESYNYSLLNLNTQSKTNCTLIHRAVSDEHKIVRLYKDSENLGSHSLLGISDVFEDVEAVTADSMIESRVDFIKMDVEGNEPFAIKGMTKILSQPKVMMVFEYTEGAVESPEAFFGALHSYNFYLFQIEHRTGKMHELTGVPHLPQNTNTNILCLKNKSILN